MDEEKMEVLDDEVEHSPSAQPGTSAVPLARNRRGPAVGDGPASGGEGQRRRQTMIIGLND